MQDTYSCTKDVSAEQICEAARFFSAHYGVWGKSAVENMGTSVKAGARVKISPKLLYTKILPGDRDNSYLSMRRGTELLGILFATRWMYQGKTILWVTQLCVHREHRNEGIAKRLLNTVKNDKDYAVGILSSHPFSISAVARTFGNGIEGIDLDVMRSEARDIMGTCPVTYVREAKLHGALFEDGSADGTISCADTQFWVDHHEPEAALQTIKDKGIVWPLGYLPEGHEYLLFVRI
ncbi:hypothetical protein ONS95_005097 [Cadophora gregata]|uniref:uncharacterized protein n=1 Tax=Cadophora gregata TaxID=51156 RepID=UPI0026DD8CC2|nr:uncharacterized protein ONS95_005097 [Cadophora gregata]KAK0104830.1 hypothetical protein ONS95_005097 [Cadophora gregata]KAK0115088.1 hypothetical protein ONS96_013558 [Cadophora gregata f. sp. sojae]